MRRAVLTLAATLLLGTTACAAAGGGSGAPNTAPTNATIAPSSMPTPAKSDPKDTGY